MVKSADGLTITITHRGTVRGSWFAGEMPLEPGVWYTLSFMVKNGSIAVDAIHKEVLAEK